MHQVWRAVRSHHTCQKQDYDRKQFGGEFGGPIVPGNIFLLAGEGTIESLPGSSGRLATVRAALLFFPLTSSARSSALPRNFDFKQGLLFRQADFHSQPHRDQSTYGLRAPRNNLSDVDKLPRRPRPHDPDASDATQVSVESTAQADFLNLLNLAYDKNALATPPT